MADVMSLDTITGGLSLNSIQAGFMDIAVYIIWGVIILSIVLFSYKTYIDKKVYMYPVRVFRQRNNGMVKEQNTFGAYIKKGNITTFVIKMGKRKKKTLDKLPLSIYMDEDNRLYFWQISPSAPLIQTKRDFHIESILAPNEKYKDPTQEEYDKLIQTTYLALKNDDNYKEQNDEELNLTSKTIVDGGLDEEKNRLIDITTVSYSPVSTDIQQSAMMDIANYRNTLGVDVNKQFAYFVMGVIALVILAIIVFYIAVNKGDIPIITEFIPLFFWKRKKNK